MVHAIVQSDLPASDKTLERIFQEVATVTAAGFETTANTLRPVLFHVYSNQKILQRLREELVSASHGSPEPIALKTLEQLPYLTAVLSEGLRLSPAIPSRSSRVTDKDLLYENWCIPAGTPVGMTTLFMHTDQTIYPDPMRFIPDQWLDDKGAAAANTFSPFSRGTRICLGMQ